MTTKTLKRPDPLGPPGVERTRRQLALAQVLLDRAEKALASAVAKNSVHTPALLAERDKALAYRDEWQKAFDKLQGLPPQTSQAPAPQTSQGQPAQSSALGAPPPPT